APCNPSINRTRGRFADACSPPAASPNSATISSRTIRTICCDGSSPPRSTPSPAVTASIARSRTRSMKALTTLKLTSASSSASRISRRADSMLSGVSLAAPRSVLKTSCRRVLRDSNMCAKAPRRAKAARRGPANGSTANAYRSGRASGLSTSGGGRLGRREFVLERVQATDRVSKRRHGVRHAFRRLELAGPFPPPHAGRLDVVHLDVLGLPHEQLHVIHARAHQFLTEFGVAALCRFHPNHQEVSAGAKLAFDAHNIGLPFRVAVPLYPRQLVPKLFFLS